MLPDRIDGVVDHRHFSGELRKGLTETGQHAKRNTIGQRRRKSPLGSVRWASNCFAKGVLLVDAFLARGVLDPFRTPQRVIRIL